MNSSASQYDSFVAYNNANKVFALKIADSLRSAGIKVWIDETEILPGDIFQDKIEQALRSVSVVIVLCGGQGLGPWEQIETRSALIESVQRGITIIPVTIPGTLGDPDLPLFLKSFSILDMTAGATPESVTRLASAIIQAKRGRSEPVAPAAAPSLPDIVAQTHNSLVISGFDLDQLTRRLVLGGQLLVKLQQRVRVTLLLVNPACNYFRSFISANMTSQPGHDSDLAIWRSLFMQLDTSLRANLELLFVNYAPAPPAVVSDQNVYLFLRESEQRDQEHADLTLLDGRRPDQESLRRDLYSAIIAPLDAPFINPFIRHGHVYDQFAASKVATWDLWSDDERSRRTVTHDFYVRFANDFHARFGWDMEREVAAHLDSLSGPSLVLGCGSGKEVNYLAKRCPHDLICGLDMSPIAIERARERDPELTNRRFLIGDFYDLDLLYKERFQSIVANAAFVHLLRREDIDHLLRRVYERLLPGGLFFLRCLYKEDSAGAPIAEEMLLGDDSRWHAHRWFVYYSVGDLTRRLRACGFEVMTDLTADIARHWEGGSTALQRAVRTKGFPHSKYAGNFWPTLLARRV
jgi:ubiquinone/menaquinone biosynthesis C-methylase UbiE